MHRRLRSLAALVICVLVAGSLAAVPDAYAGRLGGARSSSRGSSGGGGHSSSSSGGWGRSSSRGWGGGYSPYGYSPYGYGYGWSNSWYWWMFSPWWGPHRALGDDWERAVAFPGAPYIDGIDGYLRVQGRTPPAPNSETSGGRQALGNGSALRLWGEGGMDGPGFYRAGGGFLWSGYHRMELGGDLRHYWEKLEATATSPATTDKQWVGSLWVSLLFAQSPSMQFRTGFGTRWMPTDIDLILGAYFLYGMDLYIARPFVLSVQGDAGVLGEALTTTLRGTLGVVVSHVEVYGGYEMFRVGDSSLDTWVGGVRLWQ